MLSVLLSFIPGKSALFTIARKVVILIAIFAAGYFIGGFKTTAEFRAKLQGAKIEVLQDGKKIDEEIFTDPTGDVVCKWLGGCGVSNDETGGD